MSDWYSSRSLMPRAILLLLLLILLFDFPLIPIAYASILFVRRYLAQVHLDQRLDDADKL